MLKRTSVQKLLQLPVVGKIPLPATQRPPVAVRGPLLMDEEKPQGVLDCLVKVVIDATYWVFAAMATSGTSTVTQPALPAVKLTVPEVSSWWSEYLHSLSVWEPDSSGALKYRRCVMTPATDEVKILPAE